MSSENSTSVVLFALLLFGGFCVIIALISCLLEWRQRHRTASGLRAPLMDRATAHRLDVALREAEEAHAECALCGFENFHSAAACCICGQQLTAGACKPHDAAAPLNTRQQRARQRKQWVRCIGADGKLTWYRDTSSSSRSSAEQRFPGLVLQLSELVPSPPSSPSPHTVTVASAPVPVPEEESDVSMVTVTVATHTDDDTDEPGPEGEVAALSDTRAPTTVTASGSSSRLLTLATRTCELDALARTTSLQLIDASAADPALLPLVSASNTRIQWHDVLAVSIKPFPAKYAHFVTTAAALIVPATREIVKLNVRRALVLEDSVEALSVLPRANIRTTLRVNFVDEVGVDAGALQREWFALVSEQFADAASGVFACSNRADQSLYLNAHPQQLTSCFAAGRFIGRALLEGVALGFHLSLPLLKIILGQPVAFSDLEHLDPELHRNLVWILHHDGIDALGLDFSITEQPRGEGDITEVVDLVPNGRDVALTDANKLAYVTRRFEYVVFERVARPLVAFLTGFYEVIPHELLAVLDPEELDYLLCGSDEIDVDDWMAHTQYSSELLRSLPVVTWFWELVRELPSVSRQRLLHFATGSSRVPIAGFRALTSHDGRLCPFALKGVPLIDDGYIWSHACFNRLDLPLHTDREQLKAVLYATLDADIYGFTTA